VDIVSLSLREMLAAVTLCDTDHLHCRHTSYSLFSMLTYPTMLVALFYIFYHSISG